MEKSNKMEQRVISTQECYALNVSSMEKCENVGFSVFIHTQFHLITDKTYLAKENTKESTRSPKTRGKCESM